MCSIFSRIINGHVVVGRNFDWIQLGGNIHFVMPTRQYGLTTYGLCVIEQVGSDRPFEGLNSQGLFMGMAGIHADDFPARRQSDAVIDLDELGAIRFVLERAATTRQAVAILDQAQILPHKIEPYVRLQYFIADQQGDVCIIAGQEKTAIQRLDATTFAAVTNFPLSLKGQIACDRFATLEQRLPTVTDKQAVIALVEAVSQQSTVYSSLYSLTQKTVSLWIERVFQSPFTFQLDQEIAHGCKFYNFGQLKFMSAEGQDRFREAPYRVQCGFA